MAMKLVNLTLLKVNEELESFLVSYPDIVDQKILKDPDFRPKIIAYVLSRIPNRYVAIESENEASFLSQFPIYSTQEQLDMEKRIYQGIYSLSKKERKQDFYHNYPKLSSSYDRSGWFN